MRRFMEAVSIVVLAGILFSCKSLVDPTPTEITEARCKELKRQIVFNAATSDSQAAMQQRAELAKLQQAYRDNGCE